MNIIFPFSGVGAVFFPVGKLEDGGTCEFASKQCLVNCAAKKNTKRSAKLGEFGHILGYEKKKDAWDFIVENLSLLIANKILIEMSDIRTEILYWFASGDCPEKHVDKIIRVMKHISLEGIYQCGFTRNRELWLEAKQINRARLALTVEKKNDISTEKGFFAIPNYSTGRVELMYGRYVSGGTCGGSRYNIKKVDYKADCQLCFDNERGCFTK